MKRILLISLLCSLPIITQANIVSGARPLVTALIRIIRSGHCLSEQKVVIPLRVPENKTTQDSEPLFTWRDSVDDPDLEGIWEHKISCDIQPIHDDIVNVDITSDFYRWDEYAKNHTNVLIKRVAYYADTSRNGCRVRTCKGMEPIKVEVSFPKESELPASAE